MSIILTLTLPHLFAFTYLFIFDLLQLSVVAREQLTTPSIYAELGGRTVSALSAFVLCVVGKRMFSTSRISPAKVGILLRMPECPSGPRTKIALHANVNTYLHSLGAECLLREIMYDAK